MREEEETLLRRFAHSIQHRSLRLAAHRPILAQSGFATKGGVGEGCVVGGGVGAGGGGVLLALSASALSLAKKGPGRGAERARR